MSEWATLAMVAALGLEKLANRCNWYPPQGVKAVDCAASECLKFHVERSSGPTTPTTTLSAAHPPLTLSATPSNELAEFVAAARRLSTAAPIPEEMMATIQKMG